MKTITISRSAWHWRLLNYLNWEARWTDDFCSYCRWLAWALVVSAAGLVVIGLAGWCLVDFAMWVASWVKYGFDGGAGVGAILVAIVLFLVVVVGTIFIAGHLLGAAAVKIPTLLPEDSKDFVASAWESFKDKVCFRVELK